MAQSSSAHAVISAHADAASDSHQNSHDAQQRCQMTSCFFFLMALPTTEESVILDIMVKSNSVVLHHRFGCFMNPNRHRFFSEGMIVVVLTTKSLLVNTITHCLPYTGFLVHHHWLPRSGWLYLTCYPFKNAAKRQFLHISVPAYWYYLIISIRNTFLLSPCSSV